MAQPPPPGGDDDRITQPFEYRPYDLASEREKIRGRLAQILIWALVVVTAGAFLLLAFGRITVADLPTVLGAASPLVGIVGAAIGFYFGADERRQR